MNDSLMHKVHEGQNQLASNFKNVADDAEALLRHGVKNAGAAYEEARERLQESLRHARAQAIELEQAVMDGVSAAGREADRYVERHAWQAVAVAVAAGLLAGLVIARR